MPKHEPQNHGGTESGHQPRTFPEALSHPSAETAPQTRRVLSPDEPLPIEVQQALELLEYR